MAAPAGAGQFFGKIRASCDQNGIGWAVNIGTAMVQFIIKIAAANATADEKTDIPSNFVDFVAKLFETFDELIQTSGALEMHLFPLARDARDASLPSRAARLPYSPRSSCGSSPVTLWHLLMPAFALAPHP